MADDVVLNKAASIERCVARAREEYAKDPGTFEKDLTRQDAAILNLQRACEARSIPATDLSACVGSAYLRAHAMFSMFLPRHT